MEQTPFVSLFQVFAVGSFVDTILMCPPERIGGRGRGHNPNVSTRESRGEGDTILICPPERVGGRGHNPNLSTRESRGEGDTILINPPQRVFCSKQMGTFTLNCTVKFNNILSEYSTYTKCP